MIVIKLKIIFSLSYKKMNSSKGEEQQKKNEKVSFARVMTNSTFIQKIKLSIDKE
jgi:hypothetical protein